MNEQLTPELLAKAWTAETPEALRALVAEQGITWTPEEAQTHFHRIHQAMALTDAELDSISGGGLILPDGIPRVSSSDSCYFFRCRNCAATFFSPPTYFHDCKGTEVAARCGNCLSYIGTGLSGLCVHPGNFG